ncbi:hypothetical protein VPHD479_0173 [Vibrio phage D479]
MKVELQDIEIFGTAIVADDRHISDWVEDFLDDDENIQRVKEAKVVEFELDCSSIWEDGDEELDICVFWPETGKEIIFNSPEQFQHWVRENL